MAHILLAEDDQNLARGLSQTLRHSGYSVHHVDNGRDAQVEALSNLYDLLILDICLPRLDGRNVLANLRETNRSLPVLVLTALDAPEDRINGLDLGANDYMCKPFNVGELEARIRALLRQKSCDIEIFNWGPICLNASSHRVTRGEEEIELTSREFAVLEILLRRRGRLVTKTAMQDHLSNMEKDVSSNAVDVVMHRLRRKVEPFGVSIRTVRGLGFMIEK